MGAKRDRTKCQSWSVEQTQNPQILRIRPLEISKTSKPLQSLNSQKQNLKNHASSCRSRVVWKPLNESLIQIVMSLFENEPSLWKKSQKEMHQRL